jgi:hypothetical protein
MTDSNQNAENAAKPMLEHRGWPLKIYFWLEMIKQSLRELSDKHGVPDEEE